MAASMIACAIKDGIATVTLDRPDRLNAMSAADAVILAEVLDHTDANDSVRAVIVTGAGRAFCAGANLSGSSFGGEAGVVDGAEPRDRGGVLALRIFDSVKPIIAAVNGVAVGVGATMTLPMDVRIASTEARFGFVFARRGIVPESASSWFLPRIVGVSRAMDWCCGGQMFSAQEALEGGLVRSLHAPQDRLLAARKIADRMTRDSAPVSVALRLISVRTFLSLFIRKWVYPIQDFMVPKVLNGLAARAHAVGGQI